MNEMLLLYGIVLFFAFYLLKLLWGMGVLFTKWLSMKLMDIGKWDIHG